MTEHSRRGATHVEVVYAEEPDLDVDEFLS